MDLTPETLTASSPHFSSAFRPHPAMNDSIYQTPPQTRAHTDVLPCHSMAMSGLGIVNCDFQTPSTPLPLGGSTQAILPSSQCLLTESTSNSWFPNLLSSLGGYYDVGLYDDLNVISTNETSPFPPPRHHLDTPNSPTFLNSHSQRRAVNMNLQRTLDGYDFSDQTAPILKTQPKTIKYETANSAEMLPVVRNSIKRPLAQEDGSPYRLQTSSVSSVVSRNHSGMLLDSTVGRPGTQVRAQRSPLQSSNVNVRPDGSNSTNSCNEPVKKQPRKRATPATAKYQCEKCGMTFTRNSNCKSHMKIHDPNRKYPHKCTLENCTKKFSRKTDLVRHIDSVHKRLKPFVCSQCGHRFARQDTLRRHCEDGCRRQQRMSHRSGAATRPSLDCLQSNQSLPPLYSEIVSTTFQPQALSSFNRTPFPDDGSLAYSPYTTTC
ncbi:hypothetical protein VTO42DRAFT_8538 [Malbranchea cinnamomea]